MHMQRHAERKMLVRTSHRTRQDAGREHAECSVLVHGVLVDAKSSLNNSLGLELKTLSAL